MKIAILHLYSDIFTGGEYTYGFHLKEGFKQLGHECDIVVFSKSGKQLKNFQNKDFAIFKEADKIDVLKKYDYIFLLDGYLENPDYTFLKEVNKPMCTIEHNALASYRRYRYDLLFEQVGIIPVVGNSMVAKQAWKKAFNIDVEIVRQPFERKLLPPLVEKRTHINVSVVFPHRFSTNKHPETTYDFFSNKISSKADWDLHFYGSKNESVIRWTFLKDEIDVGALGENIFKDKRVWLHEPYTPILGIPKLYQSTNLTAHSTKYKEDGGRMEYTLLESIHYGNPIISYDPFWIGKLDKSLIDDAWIDGISYINMTEENLLKFADDVSYRQLLLKTSNEVVDKYFNAKESAAKILSLTF